MSNSRPLAYDRVNLFGPIAVNLLAAGDADLLVLNDEDTKFIPTSIVLETAYARGTTATDPVVVADIGTTGTNLTSSLTITDALDNQGTSNTLALLASVIRSWSSKSNTSYRSFLWMYSFTANLCLGRQIFV